jgi:hypothetical protein
MHFGAFAGTQWTALVLPTLKLSTQHGYRNVLSKHVLPYWRDWRLRDIGKLDVQQFVADKFRQRPDGRRPATRGRCCQASSRGRSNTAISR